MRGSSRVMGSGSGGVNRATSACASAKNATDVLILTPPHRPLAAHNGLVAEAAPLPSPELEEIEPAGIVLVLDQITAPHNVGAILRTAAGFAVDAVITTARHSPEATGVLAKSASGALEYVPIVTVQNLARALEALRERGYLLVGLDSSGETDLADPALRAPPAVIPGAQATGPWHST